MFDAGLGHGSGSSLPLPVLELAGISTVIAVVVSAVSIWLHLRNYRKPLLQRMVVRIMVMVPLYAVSSLISLFSLEAAFFIDVIRDIYEAFVIYCFFVLLLDYLGGERSLLILLHGRPPISAVFPVSIWRSEIDLSDPYTFLSLKRGILQYVQVKPLLALASLIMKATGTYNEGDFRARSGYMYVSIMYNISICVALWCLAVFWMCVHEDLKPFRPVPKFLCVKGILFFSFWQSIAISFFVAVGVITRLGPYTDRQHISVGLTDTLICIEMPIFALAHMYAFSYRDFTNPPTTAALRGHSAVYVARMTLGYALRDAFGLKDLVEDTRTTLRGEGINYRAFEPSEGGMHIGAARDRRIRAGLRYTAGGKGKYWLPEVRGNDNDVMAPLLAADAEDAIHDASDMQHRRGTARTPPEDDPDVENADEYALTFSDALAGPEGADESLYEQAKKYVFGDYLYPVVDVSSEEARRAMWEEEARVVREITSGGFGRHEGAVSGYGATQIGKKPAKEYDGDASGSPALSSRTVTPRTPSPSRLRTVPEHSPMTARSRTSSHSCSPTRPASRLRLPRLLAFSSAPATSSPSPSSPQQHQSRVSKGKRAPLVQEDAVDLVISAPDELQVPSTSRGGGHSPVLIRVWDELGSSAVPPLSPLPNIMDEEVLEERRAGEVDQDVPVVRVQVQEERPQDEVRARAQTPPPYARLEELRFGIPGEEEHNPWA